MAFATGKGSAAPKTLNRSGGKNRFKFAKLTDRLAVIDVNIGKTLRQESFAAAVAAIDDGEGLQRGLFSDQLSQLRDTSSASRFEKLCREIAPITYSEPQLLHHLPDVVIKIVEAIED